MRIPVERIYGIGDRGARIKTLAPDYQEKSVYKKMLLSIEFPRLQRVTVYTLV